MNYRKIWEDANNKKIPEGYEIHHIDGDNTNNAPENLMCVSIEQHLEIHESQNDWDACQAILMRMDRTEETIAKIRKAASNHQRKLLKEGTHNFQMSKERRRQISQETIAKRETAFLGIDDPVENSRRAGLVAAEKKAGFLDTSAEHHGSKYVKGTKWWTNAEGKHKRAKESPGESWTRGMTFEG